MRDKLLAALQIPPEKLPSCTLEPVTIAVLDSGVDSSHPALLDKVLQSVIVEDGHIRVREVGVNNDPFGHGTAVASILTKLAPNAKILDICVLGTRANNVGPSLLRGLQYAIEQNAALINMSLASTQEYAARLNVLCEQAYRNGQSVVAATRNMPLTDHGFPAEFSSVISVDHGADVESMFRWYFRQAHPIPWIANGSELTVAAAGGGYTTKTGTSFATPVVTAICALWLGAFGHFHSFELKTLLRAFAQ